MRWHCNDVIGNLHVTIWYAAPRVTQTIFAVLDVWGYHVVLTRSFKLLSFLHLYLLFYGRGYRTVSAILLLDWVMIIISYTSPTKTTITISLSLSMWSQFAMQASTCCTPRNQEHISYRSPVVANFLLKFSNFCCHGNQGQCGVSINDTIGFAAIEKPYIAQESGTYLP